MLTPESYFRISPIVAPIGTIVYAAILSYGAFRAYLRMPLAILALGMWLLGASNSYWLILQIQKLSGRLLISQGLADSLFPIQALCFYAGIGIVIVGDAILVWRASRGKAT